MHSITIGSTASNSKGDMSINEFLKKLDKMGIQYHKKKDIINQYHPSPYYEIYLENGTSKEEMIEMVKETEYTVILA